jgi:hypothetical protein
VLFCRTVTDAYTFGSTYCVVEDLLGTAITLVLNTYDPRIVVDPDPALRRGTLLAVKEPRVVGYTDIDPEGAQGMAEKALLPGTAAGRAATTATTAMVWVNSPSDAVELDAAADAEMLAACGHGAWADADAGKSSAQSRGDAALGAGNAKAALRTYDAGLGSEPGNVGLVQGKAESLLRLGRCTEAYEVLEGLVRGRGTSADTVGGDGGGDAKTTRLLAQAAEGAHKWAVAVDSYKRLLQLSASAGAGTDTITNTQSDLRVSLERAERRLRETRGEFDYARLLRTSEATALYSG